MKRALAWGGGLIALYLLVVHETGSGTLITDSANGVTSVITAFQGR